jgi:formate dehydrogenase major subunit
VVEGGWVTLASRSGETELRVHITDRVPQGVVYTTFHHPVTGANVVTTEYSDWATNCPEYKVTAVQVRARVHARRAHESPSVPSDPVHANVAALR